MITVIRRAVELGVTFFVVCDRYPEKFEARTGL